jgi:hypothetical protein
MHCASWTPDRYRLAAIDVARFLLTRRAANSNAPVLAGGRKAVSSQPDTELRAWSGVAAGFWYADRCVACRDLGPLPMLRRLLIIASIGCLAACLASLAMWVRSYYRSDLALGHFAGQRGFQIVSKTGRIVVYLGSNGTSTYSIDVVYPWAIESYRVEKPDLLGIQDIPDQWLSRVGFSAFTNRIGQFVIFPYWFVAFVTGSLAMLFRTGRSWQFKLRSLFLATTCFAILLGLINWLDKAWMGK